MKKRNLSYRDYFNNIKERIKDWKSIYWIKFRGRCPVCKGNKLQFIEGCDKLRKWFCTECTCFSHVILCKHCGKQNLVGQKYKEHIFKEYQLGKYRNKEIFFNDCQKSYFKGQIKFHKQSVKDWKEMYDVWKKKKNKQLMYGKG